MLLEVPEKEKYFTIKLNSKAREWCLSILILDKILGDLHKCEDGCVDALLQAIIYLIKTLA